MVSGIKVADSQALSKANGSVGSGANGAVLEGLYEEWRREPSSVDPTWRAFFEGFELGCQQPPAEAGGAVVAGGADPAMLRKQGSIFILLFSYRMLGHYIANLDPLGFNKTELPELELGNFGFSESDLDTVFESLTVAGGGPRTLREIVGILKDTYCDTLGVEYMHIQDFKSRYWLRERMETCRNRPDFDAVQKKRILYHLLEAELFEHFLHTRYVGKKRFSLEGGEILIPALDSVLEACPRFGIRQVVMGMAHRGRLNVLANILGKDLCAVFSEFHDKYVSANARGDGDVKYHQGYEAVCPTLSGESVGVSLAPNPSHLEAVDPVVEGKARAWQRRLGDMDERSSVLPVLVHGDAAFIGQGVVAETFNLSQVDGYRTGGTLHIIVNNQIGFTTLPQDGRSTPHCTAIAQMLGIPIFHVNCDDPLKAVYAIELALEFRQKFHRDVVVDLVCYRRLGHNEGDEPSFTQPTLYSAIKRHPGSSRILMDHMIEGGELGRDEVDEYVASFKGRLEDALNACKPVTSQFVPAIKEPMSCPQLLEPFDSSVEPGVLREVGEAITMVPEGHRVNAKIGRLMEQRGRMARGEEPVDWAFAEALAFGTLLREGVPIRLSGQDSRRGTFSQRHSVLYDIETRERYIPLRNVARDQATICIYNSPLSEAAVLGFDYGYSLDYPEMLAIWEAQFGDFANGAQVMIDQYICSSESKWGVTSRIVLLLPHGYDGQGPEHSSARLERFLQLCAEDNIQVANCTTPANYFHILRRQALRVIRKPLVLMTPKSLLRDPRCASDLAEIAAGRFHEILPDAGVPSGASRVVLCSGKVYFDLLERRKQAGAVDTAIIRLEQLHPLHAGRLKEVVAAHAPDAELVWCQEESENMGAWTFIEPRLRRLFGREIRYAGRDASSSPSTGSHAIHELEQRDLVERAIPAA